MDDWQEKLVIAASPGFSARRFPHVTVWKKETVGSGLGSMTDLLCKSWDEEHQSVAKSQAPKRNDSVTLIKQSFPPPPTAPRP